MKRVIVIVASGLALAACTTGGGNLDFLPKFEPKPVDVQFVSTPPGAEARTTTGQTCQTPCTLQLTPDKDFQVTFTLANYQPQTISVQPVKSEETWETTLQPNPVDVQLVATTPPRRGSQRRTSAPARPAAPRAAAPRPAATQPAAAPPAASAPPPPAAPSANDPWPQVR